MKKHSGMRPHDIVILLKIAAKGAMPWLMKDLSAELSISASEVSESINRSVQAGLLSPDKKRLMRSSLLEFLQFGLPYVFPQRPGALVRGIPTAHSAPPLNKLIQSEDQYVWPSAKGNVRGQSIEPLYESVIKAIGVDHALYEILALVDAIRVGRVREKQLAIEELKKDSSKMLKNKTINISVIKKVAKALGDLNDQVAYVGGATVSLYADDPAADDARPTKDIDIILHIANFGELTALQEKLGQKGIYPDPESKVVCRFKYDDILIDVMSTKEVGWAPSDQWFEPGFNNLITFTVDEETTIRIFPVAYFLATKFSAFHDRGDDPRASKDFEDVVYVLDNRVNIEDEIKNAPDEVHAYLKLELSELLNGQMNEALASHLSPFSRDERLRIVKEKIKIIVA